MHRKRSLCGSTSTDVINANLKYTILFIKKFSGSLVSSSVFILLPDNTFNFQGDIFVHNVEFILKKIIKIVFINIILVTIKDVFDLYILYIDSFNIDILC